LQPYVHKRIFSPTSSQNARPSAKNLAVPMGLRLTYGDDSAFLSPIDSKRVMRDFRRSPIAPIYKSYLASGLNWKCYTLEVPLHIPPPCPVLGVGLLCNLIIPHRRPPYAAQQHAEHPQVPR
jgi:hypothetical protein